MLMPLETLPGWPEAPNPTALHALGLLLGIPFILAVLIGGASYLATNRDLRRYGPPINPAVVYAGGDAVAGTQSSAAIEPGPGVGDGAGVETGTGGTSARW